LNIEAKPAIIATTMNPKAFISYSWTSPNQEAWVLKVATELRELGVDVIFDKWDLKEGHDAIAFMEQMVTNPDIRKVILVCDRKYAEKTDNRAGGVGTEAQIISPAVYSKSDQSKFVAVATEIGPDGKPFLPTYYKGRIYIDLSGDDVYAQNFEQLVRWIYDKPVNVKPALGKPPAYLSETEGPRLANAALQRRAVDAVKNARPYAKGAVDEYFDSCIEGLEAFRIAGGEHDFDERVVKSIEDFLPYRAQIIEVFVALVRYRSAEAHEQVHRFFERLVPFLDVPADVRSFLEWDPDNLRFVVQELFIYLIAVSLKYEAFDFAAEMMRQPYYIAKIRGDRRVTASFAEFGQHLRSLDHRNKRLQLRRYSVQADLLERRSHASGLDFWYLMQADFTLFLRGALDQLGGIGRQWMPETLVYSERLSGPFEIFARAQSKRYFERVAILFDISKKDELHSLIQAFKEGRKVYSPTWEFTGVDSARLMGFDELATKP
jgi:SEFIR domain